MDPETFSGDKIVSFLREGRSHPRMETQGDLFVWGMFHRRNVCSLHLCLLFLLLFVVCCCLLLFVVCCCFLLFVVVCCCLLLTEAKYKKQGTILHLKMRMGGKGTSSIFGGLKKKLRDEAKPSNKV